MTWAIGEMGYSQRQACKLFGLEPKTYRYASKRSVDGEVCTSLRGLAAERRRFGYRRLHILLAREGVRLNHKRLFWIYREERLEESAWNTVANDVAGGCKPQLVVAFVSDVLGAIAAGSACLSNGLEMGPSIGAQSGPPFG